jgi:hypothetical protein
MNRKSVEQRQLRVFLLDELCDFSTAQNDTLRSSGVKTIHYLEEPWFTFFLEHFLEKFVSNRAVNELSFLSICLLICLAVATAR